MRFFTVGIAAAAGRNFGIKGFSSKPSYGSKTKYKGKTTKESKQRRPKIQWTDEQKSVLSAVEQGSSVFITGSAGTGKTTLVAEVVKLLKKLHTRSRVYVTASTGVAAFAIKGQTLHSFSGIDIETNYDPQNLLEAVIKKRGAIRNWNKVKALVIDEISMVDAKLFDGLEFIARNLKDVEETWGGIQLVVVGDFCQLSPFVENSEDGKKSKSVNYAFEAVCWNDCFDLQIELTKIFRQSDPRFIKLLQAIRRGKSDHPDMALLKECSKTKCDPSAVQLFPFNKNVKRVNEKQLKSLQKDVVVYRAVDRGDNSKKQQFEKGIAASVITICKGARVMLIKNLNTWKGLVNGATGTVMGFDEAVDVGDISSDNRMPIVQFDSGDLLTIKPVEWHVMDGDRIVATRQQIPIILAWALSIHKCQGMTLDKAKINLSGAFAYGMAYTALSRVKSLEDLCLSGFKPSVIQADSRVSQFYRNLALQHNSKDLDNSCIESKDTYSSITGDSKKASIADKNDIFSLERWLANRQKFLEMGFT